LSVVEWTAMDDPYAALRQMPVFGGLNDELIVMNLAREISRRLRRADALVAEFANLALGRSAEGGGGE